MEKIKDYSFKNMEENIETDESKSHEHSNPEKSPSNIDEFQMSNSDQLTDLGNGPEISTVAPTITLKDGTAPTNQKTSSEIETITSENIKLSETIEFLETEARIHQETLELESKERMKKAAIVIQVGVVK